MELLIIGLILVFVIAGIANWSKGKERRELIQSTGVRVLARVTNVKKRSDYHMDASGRHGVFHDYYQITAEWTDPRTGRKYTITSGEKVGRSPYRKGDSVSACISPHGTSLEL